VGIDGLGTLTKTTTNLASPNDSPVTVSTYVRTPSGSPSAVIVLMDWTGAVISTSDPVVMSTTWQRISVSGVITSNNAYGVMVRIPAAGSVAGQVIQFDGTMGTLGGELLDYFDGSTTADASYTYAWTGTAHASSSVRTPV
jgi:hypothetical protein